VNISDEREILKKRLRDKEHRDAFVSAYTDETIPFQIRALREQEDRRWTQEELASRAGMKQERISTVENPNYGSYSLRILKQLASAFDVALVVRFIPFSELAEWKLNLSSKSLEVPSFDEEDYFKENPMNQVATDLLKDHYSQNAGRQPTKQSNGVVKSLISYRQRRQPKFEEKLSPIQDKMSEDINEVTIG
jgi:transcriptional regulator with XRE-family HTH domain